MCIKYLACSFKNTLDIFHQNQLIFTVALTNFVGKGGEMFSAEGLESWDHEY